MTEKTFNQNTITKLSAKDKYMPTIIILIGIMWNVFLRNMDLFYRTVQGRKNCWIVIILLSLALMVILLRQMNGCKSKFLLDAMKGYVIFTAYMLLLLCPPLLPKSKQLGMWLLVCLAGVVAVVWMYISSIRFFSRVTAFAMVMISLTVFQIFKNYDLESLKKINEPLIWLFGFPRVGIHVLSLISFAIVIVHDSQESKKTESYIEKNTSEIQEGDYGRYFYNLAKQYTTGNQGKAMEYYLMSAGQGFSQAEADLGSIYYYGYFGEQDYEKSAMWYKRAAEHSHAGAQYSIGICYQNGNGVPKNTTEAFKWVSLSADQGFAQAQYALWRFYRDGIGVAPNKKTAIEWLEKAAENGDARSQYDLSQLYFTGNGVEKDESIGLVWLQSAVEKNFPSACYMIGRCYLQGIAKKKDPEKAIPYLTKGAELGDEKAMYYLAECLADGEGIAKNPEDSVRWYRASAEHGLAQAQARLAFCYHEGEGIQKDYKQAAYWIQKAAENNFPYAMFYLGEFYEKGIGVEKNTDQALFWYKKAKNAGYEKADEAISKLEVLKNFEK